MPEAEINGIRIHYEERGNPEGEPIVFFHGALAAHRSFAGQFPAVAGTHRILAWDARGHGSSTHYGEEGNPWPNMDPRVMEQDAIAFLEQVAGGPAHVVGVSMGGITGSRIAAYRPDLLKSLTLISAASAPDPRFVQLFGRMTPDSFSEMEKRLFQRWHGEPYWRELASHFLDYFSKLRPERYPGEAVRAYTGPVLVAIATDDALLGPQHLVNWTTWFPQAKVHAPATGGHAFFADGRQGTKGMNEALVAFLGSL
ncbi:MAG TPA: alpha/beta hydrolase [Candidatus Thermoplasmatota archaeon]|nr:alpha/beta hydrolase [Candidatus Thermoplasmatota archaeon]